MSKINKRLIIFSFVFLILGILIGYSWGATQSLNWCVKVGLKFVDIDIDEQMLKTALYQYKNHIGGCLFTQNASIFNDSWNKKRS